MVGAAPASWWIAVLFLIGSACFAIGPFPGFVQLVGAAADAAVFFVGLALLHRAAALQYLEAVNADRGPDRWASGGGCAWPASSRIASTGGRRWSSSPARCSSTSARYEALQQGLSTAQDDHLIWAPDVFGCACFLIASALA